MCLPFCFFSVERDLTPSFPLCCPHPFFFGLSLAVRVHLRVQVVMFMGFESIWSKFKLPYWFMMPLAYLCSVIGWILGIR